MRGKNYTNPEDRGRFGFSESGKFNTPYKLDFVLNSVAVGIAAAAVVFIIINSVRLMRLNITGVDSGLMLEALIIGVTTVIIIAVVLFVLLMILKFISEGFVCSYIADENKFTADIGGTHRTIYYNEVQYVHFQPRSFLGKVNGYNVIVKVSGTNELFSVVSSGFISEKTTPFYIIKERAELLRAEEEEARELEKKMSAVGVDKPFPEVMPSGGSPRVRGFVKEAAPSMPSVGISQGATLEKGAAGIVPNAEASQNSMYTDEHGIERRINDIVAQGTFNVALEPKQIALISVIAAVAYAIVLYFVFFRYYLQLPFILMCAALPLYAALVIWFISFGSERRYSANGREFVIYGKRGAEEHILYSDVQSVDYKPLKLLGFNIGRRVEILTKYGVLKYNFIFNKKDKRRNRDSIPFEEIRKRVGFGRDM